MVMVRALAATGALGTGYKVETLRRALEMKPDFIGCDAGSTDPGPYYLGAGECMASRAAIKRDLSHIVIGAVEYGIPLLVGTAGTSGGTPHLAWTADIVREIAAENGLSFTMATIGAEQDAEMLVEALAAGRITPLENAPTVTAESLRGAERIVAVNVPCAKSPAPNPARTVPVQRTGTDSSVDDQTIRPKAGMPMAAP
jgi:hypothetical protein